MGFGEKSTKTPSKISTEMTSFSPCGGPVSDPTAHDMPADLNLPSYSAQLQDDRARGTRQAIPLRPSCLPPGTIRPLTAIVEFLNIDLENPLQLPGPRGAWQTVSAVATDEGRADAVIFWWKIALRRTALGPTYSTREGSAPYQDHWLPMLLGLPEDMRRKVSAGEALSVASRHDDSRVWFELAPRDPREVVLANRCAALPLGTPDIRAALSDGDGRAAKRQRAGGLAFEGDENAQLIPPPPPPVSSIPGPSDRAIIAQSWGSNRLARSNDARWAESARAAIVTALLGRQGKCSFG